MQALIAAQTESRLDGICRSLELVRRQLDETPAEAARSTRPARTPPKAAPARPAARPAQPEPEEEDDLMEPFAVVPFEY